MPREIEPRNSTTPRYSEQEKAAAVRMVRRLRKDLGSDHGTVKRVAVQLGYGPESVQSWVRESDIDRGHALGQSAEQSTREKRRDKRTSNFGDPTRT